MKKNKKIAIVGAGNAGCVTALHYDFYGRDKFDITIYHSPEDYLIERVGQGTLLHPITLISQALNIDWYNNPIDATFKSGFLYEGWGQKKDKLFHPLTMNTISMHFVPQKLSKAVLESGLFEVVEKTIDDPEKEIDADYIFDCRGRKNRDRDNYEPLINPLNSVLLYASPEKDVDLYYTRCVTTPNGWTFIIPNIDSVSYGYLYNNTITPKEEATQDFLKRFDLPETDGELDFENYIAKNMFVGERTILNGNRCAFLEPLESTALDFYIKVCQVAWDHIVGGKEKSLCNKEIRLEMKKIQTFVLWHYKKGSKYKSPFWDYAQSLPFKTDIHFEETLERSKNVSFEIALRLMDDGYAQWDTRSFKIWNDNT